MTKIIQNSKVDKLKAPRFSTAIGWKIKLDAKLEYFANFRSAAIIIIIITEKSTHELPCHFNYITALPKKQTVLLKIIIF